jgi:hypothetical protein
MDSTHLETPAPDAGQPGPAVDASPEQVEQAPRPSGNRFGRLLDSLQSTLHNNLPSMPSMPSMPSSISNAVRRTPAEPPQSILRPWAVPAAEAAGDGALQGWLEALPPRDEKTLETAAAEFAAALHFQLTWVTEPELLKDLPVQGALHQALLGFLQAYRLAHQAQPEFAPITAWIEWGKNPGKNMELTQQIFAVLFDQGRVTLTRDFITLPEKERAAFMVETIQEFQKQDGSAFYEVFKLAQEALSAGKPSGAPETDLPESAAETPPADPQPGSAS